MLFYALGMKEGTRGEYLRVEGGRRGLRTVNKVFCSLEGPKRDISKVCSPRCTRAGLA